jgi:hypothetical protein
MMTMKLLALATLFLLCLTFSGSSDPSRIRTWTPGVPSGDYVYYDMYGVYTSNPPNKHIAIPQFEYNNTDWTRINITSVEGSVVNQIYTLHFKNGTEISFNFKCDVNPDSNSGLRFNEKGVPLCAADLNVGDTLSTDETVIDEVVSKTGGSTFREAIHASWNSSIDWGDLYFDRETGILVELYRTHRFTNASSGDIIDKTDVIKISGTNRWQVNQENTQAPPTLQYAILTISIVGLLCSLAVICRFAIRKANNRRFANNSKLQMNRPHNIFAKGESCYDRYGIVFEINRLNRLTGNL